MGELARKIVGGGDPIKKFINGNASGSSSPTTYYGINFPENAEGEWYGVFQFSIYSKPATYPYVLAKVIFGTDNSFTYNILYSDLTMGTVTLDAPIINTSSGTKNCTVRCSAISGGNYCYSYSFKLK